MTDPHSPGAFAHQHEDQRGLLDRIQAQLRARIEEAVEMAALKLLVDERARLGRGAPETSNEADRREFEAAARALLAHLESAFVSELDAAIRHEVERAEAGYRTERERLLAGHVYLARRLPDYWQRLEKYHAAYAEARRGSPSQGGWLPRLFRR
jgi:hypothetical protein